MASSKKEKMQECVATFSFIAPEYLNLSDPQLELLL